MLTLTNLRNLRTARNLSRPLLSELTSINLDRLAMLERKDQVEPWFEECVRLVRVLGTSGIRPLIVSDNLTEIETEEFPTDLAAWRSPAHKPLSLAFRIACRFGLDDPYDLCTTHLARQVWSVVEACERLPVGSGPGTCPWCIADVRGGSAHLPTCLPHNLWAPHDGPVPESMLLPTRKVPRAAAIPAWGLRQFRDRKGWRQREVAERMEVNVNHYARMERGQLPLTLAQADKLAAIYGVERSVLYAKPAETGDA